MRVRIAYIVFPVTLLLSSVSAAQRSALGRASIEVVAARLMLANDSTNSRIAINASYGASDEAPSVRDVGPRPATSNAKMAEALHATVRGRSATILCAKLTCSLINADVLLTLSEPRISGDTAVSRGRSS